MKNIQVLQHHLSFKACLLASTINNPARLTYPFILHVEAPVVPSLVAGTQAPPRLEPADEWVAFTRFRQIKSIVALGRTRCAGAAVGVADAEKPGDDATLPGLAVRGWPRGFCIALERVGDQLPAVV